MRATLSEMGMQVKLPPSIGNLPPGNGKWTSAHFETFGSVYMNQSRAYQGRSDEATRDSLANALAFRRDPVITGALRKLIQPICQLPWKIKPRREDDAQQKDAAELITEIINDMPRPGLIQMWRMLLESRFYGRYGVSTRFEWKNEPWMKQPRCQVADFYPVNGDKIVFQYDGTPGLLVNKAFYDGPAVVTDRGYAHILTLAEQETFFWCEFEPEDSDYTEGQLAGAVHGQGFRHRLYWLWWTRQNVFQSLVRFLRRCASGWNIAWFDMHNDGAEAALRTLLAEYDNEDVLLMPRDRKQETAYGFDHYPINMSGSQVWIDIIRWLDEMMTDYVLGEVLTTGTAATGLGSGVAETHQSTADARTRYHSADLIVGFQPLVNVLYRYNCPGVAPGNFEFQIEKRDPKEYMEACQFAYDLGMPLDQEDIYEALDLVTPKPGTGILAKMSPGQPAGMEEAPMGMPVAGQPGPDEQPPTQQGVDYGQAQQSYPTDPSQPGQGPAGQPA